MTIKAQSDQSDTPRRRWWIYPLPDGTLQAAPDTPTWGGGGILVEEVRCAMTEISDSEEVWMLLLTTGTQFKAAVRRHTRDAESFIEEWRWYPTHPIKIRDLETGIEGWINPQQLVGVRRPTEED